MIRKPPIFCRRFLLLSINVYLTHPVLRGCVNLRFKIGKTLILVSILRFNIMCFSPITIVNPCKYVDVRRKDRFLLQVPCGKCAECQEAKSREWHFRTYYEFLRTFEYSKDAFVYFDTLTYDDDHLPYMDEIIPELPHLPCFRSSDVTKFFKRLRISLSREFNLYKDAFSYFLCSEYGSLKGRPHYHLLLFFRYKIDPLKLSCLISEKWSFGRTDGVPYKSNFYVLQHNVVRNDHLGDVIACAKYVTKYVEKDCKLQSVIDQRIKNAEMILSSDKYPYKKRGSVAFRKMMTKLASEVNQFHLQSLHFGELALRDLDFNELERTGCVKMPSHQVVSLVILPSYYQRKIFYDKYKLDGNFGWQLNDFGKEFKSKRLPYLRKQIISRLHSLSILCNFNCDCEALADYLLNERGRFRGDAPESLISERLDTITHYVYSTQSDKESVGIGVSFDFLGNSKLGYSPFSSNIIKIKDFVSKYVYLNQEFENQLQLLYVAQSSVNDGKQSYYARVQELKSKFKSFGE